MRFRDLEISKWGRLSRQSFIHVSTISTGDFLSEPRKVRETFIALVLIGFFARLSYGMARTPLLALFARA